MDKGNQYTKKKATKLSRRAKRHLSKLYQTTRYYATSYTRSKRKLCKEVLAYWTKLDDNVYIGN